MEYGDREVVADRMAQIQAQSGAPKTGNPTQALGQATDRLGAGPVSDLPVTDGLSVGPGRSPGQSMNPMQSPAAEKWRILASEARSPQLRALARKKLQLMMAEGMV